ncbi:MAG: hypothetical protein AAGF12_12260 [Myxococcota bacterium]
MTAGLWIPPAGAQDGDVAVVVLPGDDGGDAERARAVDAELLRVLAEVAGLEQVRLSPIGYEDARLSVGCGDDEAACLDSVASLSDVNAVVLRRIRGGDLELVYYDRSAPGEPVAAQGSIPEGVAGVEPIVRRLFGLPEAVVANPREDADDEDEEVSRGPVVQLESPSVGPSISPFTWIALGVGALAGTLGAVFLVLADEAYQDFKGVTVGTQEDADEANELLDTANSRGTVGTVFLISGGLAIGAGIALLVAGLLGGDEDATAFAPTILPGGGGLQLAGTFGE